ncbi:MAG: rhomboid family intramembrane serine protease [Bacteroidota bacterium]|nr:rhomboid family intramembrane serine protease [Bacteroidota bacterium]
MNDLTPYATIALLILICGISFIAFSSPKLLSQLRHYPYQEQRDNSFYRWITCTFVHGSYIHLFLNAFVLYQFGFIVERIYQSKFGSPVGMGVYAGIYLVLAILSTIPSYFKHKNNPQYASIGASGVISGLLFIYILYFPFEKIYLYFAIGMPSFLFGILYLVYSWWAAKNTRDGIDHDAHYYGAIGGILVGLILDPSVLNSIL